VNRGYRHTLETRFVSVTGFVEILSPSLKIAPFFIGRANGPIVLSPNFATIQGEIGGPCTGQIAIPGGISTEIWSPLKSSIGFSRRLMRTLTVSSGANEFRETGIA
jgi:hypothetical protein